ncbi:MAG: hypothetical protein PVI91_14570 [Gammaproteobacteria bacterium]|jgi:hypothetical protein
MSNITIHDLAHTTALDEETRRAHRGGSSSLKSVDGVESGVSNDLTAADAGPVALLPPFGRLGNERADFGLTIYA